MAFSILYICSAMISFRSDSLSVMFLVTSDSHTHTQSIELKKKERRLALLNWSHSVVEKSDAASLKREAQVCGFVAALKIFTRHGRPFSVY